MTPEDSPVVEQTNIPRTYEEFEQRLETFRDSLHPNVKSDLHIVKPGDEKPLDPWGRECTTFVDPGIYVIIPREAHELPGVNKFIFTDTSGGLHRGEFKATAIEADGPTKSQITFYDTAGRGSLVDQLMKMKDTRNELLLRLGKKSKEFIEVQPFELPF